MTKRGEIVIASVVQDVIWGYLSPDALCTVSQVCTSFYQTSKDDALWKRFILPFFHSAAAKVGFKTYFIQTIKDFFSKITKHRNVGFWLARQALEGGDSSQREEYLNRYSYLSQYVSLRAQSQLSQPENDFDFKIILIGDSNVGKTCLSKSYVTERFSFYYPATIDPDYRVKNRFIDKESVNLYIWDAFGERFRPLFAPFYRDSHGAILTFSLQSQESLNSCESWIEELESNSNTPVQITLCGAKGDLQHKVSQQKILDFCLKHKIQYYETSAKEGWGMTELFDANARAILNGHPVSLRLPEIASNLRSVLDVEKVLQLCEPLPESASSWSSWCSIQ